jgi:hypothetical protein
MFEDYETVVEDDDWVRTTGHPGVTTTIVTTWTTGAATPSTVRLETTVAPSTWATKLSSVMSSMVMPAETEQGTQRPASFTTEATSGTTEWQPWNVVSSICVYMFL